VSRLPGAQALALDALVTPTAEGIASRVLATPGTIVRLPAAVPHALEAPEPARMLLVMLRDPPAG
jgi:hypothetical protein